MEGAKNSGTRGVALAIVALVTSLIGVSLSRLVYPYDVGYYEAVVWEPSLLAANGLNHYNYALRPPFVMAPYGYLYYLMIGLGLRLFGLQLWLGRLTSILAAAIIVICIWRISGSLTREPQAAAFAVVVFLSSITLQSWIAVQRSRFAKPIGPLLEG
jgi:4-amino-4-deoxy-L-arabinose transferase-like glycosyltransferase